MYEKFVQEHAGAFGDNLKTVQDIAKILDHPVARVWKIEQDWVGPYNMRCDILKGFYALCVHAGVSLPAAEDIFCNESGQRINFTDQYLNHPQPSCLCSKGASRPVHVLIVDDIAECLLSSAYALVGIPNLTVDFYHCAVGVYIINMQMDRIFEKMYEDIESQAKDIVLMDEGLGLEVSGSDLVKKMKENGSKIVFVANSGRDAKYMVSVGCLPNFKKGIGDPIGILQALDLCT